MIIITEWFMFTRCVDWHWWKGCPVLCLTNNWPRDICQDGPDEKGVQYRVLQTTDQEISVKTALMKRVSSIVSYKQLTKRYLSRRPWWKGCPVSCLTNNWPRDICQDGRPSAILNCASSSRLILFWLLPYLLLLQNMHDLLPIQDPLWLLSDLVQPDVTNNI